MTNDLEEARGRGQEQFRKLSEEFVLTVVDFLCPKLRHIMAPAGLLVFLMTDNEMLLRKPIEFMLQDVSWDGCGLSDAISPDTTSAVIHAAKYWHTHGCK